MAPLPKDIAYLLRGPGCAAGLWPILLTARWCDLGRSFLPKGRVGRSFRAVSRNGRVLLASDLPLEDLRGRCVQARLQTWHRTILAGTPPDPFGVLVCLRGQAELQAQSSHVARLVAAETTGADLVIDVGALRLLELRRLT
jgi:hypothetical protein